ncbi:MAG: response regulator [Acidobacteriia bacterium]|nr:response regulator [Terriglobia bacterium]
MASLKLLIVEDNSASLELMTEVLTSLKAEVRPVSDSKKALSLVKQEKFDGIFLDLEMPDLHGFELARLIRDSSWNKTTPIIVVTGRDDRQTMRQAFEAGATFFLQKPVDRQRLSGLYRAVRGGLLESRRRHLRVPLQTEVVCTVGPRTLRGQSWNLSQGGIQVEVSGLQSGDTVRVAWRLPASDVDIDVTGVVAWAGERRQGIRFTEINDRNQASIRRFVSEMEE